MASPSNRYIILGNGIAALSALQTLNQLQPNAHVDVFSIEPDYAYFSSTLGRLLQKLYLEEKYFYLTNRSFYSKLNATLHRNTRILEIDFKAQRLRVERANFPYDQLLIATGVSSKRKSLPLPVSQKDKNSENGKCF